MPEEKDAVLGRIAVERGYVSQEQLDVALEIQRQARDDMGLDMPLVQVLVNRHLLSPDQAQELRNAVAVETGEARLVAGYEVVSKLGQGGFGVVYKAKQAETGQFVALKILPPSLASEDRIARFKRESEIVRGLDHENIVSWVEFGYDPKRKVHFCALELVEGEDLAKRIARQGVLAEAEALSITKQVAMALQHACFNGLVHRDVKPGNIMVTPDGTAKLLDLGLARPARAEATKLTQTGAFVGSAYYASPEQAKSEGAIDTRSDIYSLGATLYHMVTGKPPFQGSNVAHILYQQAYEKLTWPAEVNPELSDGMCRVIAKMLAKDPADRYQVPNDLLRDIDVLEEGGEPEVADVALKNSSVALAVRPRMKRKRPPSAPRHARAHETAARPDHGRRHARADEPSASGMSPTVKMWAMLGVGAAVFLLGLVATLTRGRKPERKPTGAGQVEAPGERGHAAGDDGRAPDVGGTDVSSADVPAGRSVSPAGPPSSTSPAPAALEAAEEYEAANPDDTAGIRRRYAEVVKAFSGTAAAVRAEVRLDDLDRAAASASEEADWQRIFNGRDMTGWRTYGGRARIEDGALVSEDAADILYSAEWREFALDCEVIFTSPGMDISLAHRGTGRGGGQVRVRLHNDGDAHVYAGGKRLWQSGTGKFPPGRWMHLRLHLTRGGLRIEKDGDLMGTADLSRVTVEKGGVSFWSWDKGCTARMRNIRVRPPDTKAGPRRPAGVPADAARFGGHWYKLCRDSMNWHDAKAFCEKHGGHLVTITSKEENDFVTALAQTAGANPWIGLQDRNLTGRWGWVTGEPVDFAAWGTGEPNNDSGQEECAHLHRHRQYGGKYRWNDVSPTDRASASGFVCEWEPAAPGRTLTLDLGGGVTMEFVNIKPGVFMMGSVDTEWKRLPWEGPQHEVEITRGFWMGKCEVTQAQYERIMRASPSRFKAADRPVEQVSWDEAVEFCRRMSVRTGRKCCLPTDAEWEYACRAGTTTSYHFGDSWREVGKYAWHSRNSGEQTHPVGQKLPNAWGLHDMTGNVWEWCADVFDKSYYAGSPRQDPTGPAAGSARAVRGGSWFWASGPGREDGNSIPHCRSACRTGEHHTHRSPHVGFRVALTVSPEDTRGAPEMDPGALLTGFDSLMEKGDHAGAREYAEREAAKPANAAHAKLFEAAVRVAKALETRPAAMRKGAEALVGQEVRLRIATGAISGKLKEVADDKFVVATTYVINRQKREKPVDVPWKALHDDDLARLADRGGWDVPAADRAVAGAWAAFASGDLDAAAAVLSEKGAADHLLTEYLKGRVAEAKAEAALAQAVDRARGQMALRQWEKAAEALKTALAEAGEVGTRRYSAAGAPDPGLQDGDAEARSRRVPTSLAEARRLLAEAEGHIGPAPTLTLDLGNNVTMDFVYIKPGRFVMGSSEEKREDWRAVEKPPHEVTITKGFYLGQYEVTQAQYQAVVGTNPSHFKGPDLPVEAASWNDAADFCRKLSERSGKQARLPTEAEWEYACRAGSVGPYCFGSDETGLGDCAWYNANSGGQTHPVGQKKPNAWGLYDIHGNVWEWVGDWASDTYYASSPAADPTGPTSGDGRVLRGGSWNYLGRECRSAFRLRCDPARRGTNSGFRVAVAAPRVSAAGRRAYDRAMSRAKMRIGLRNWKGAIESLEGALAAKPEDAEAKKLLAEAQSHIGPAPTLTLDLGGNVTMELVYIEPGVFMMGDEAGRSDEKPGHEVAITRGFYIGKYEVTQSQYEAVMGRNPSRWKGPSRPVEQVRWHDAGEFCRLAAKKTGRPFRLPTEAEWEYACRAGSTGKWCFGDNGAPLGDYAWFQGNSGGQTHVVGGKRPNAWGLHDMHGGVWEWVADRYAAKYHARTRAEDPTGPDTGNHHPLRGGSWITHGDHCRSAVRRPETPSYVNNFVGFRVAVTPSPREP